MLYLPCLISVLCVYLMLFSWFDRYMGFLADSGLLDRLTAITVRGRGLDTRLLLCEHAEKIQAAIAVRKTHNQ